MFVDLGLKVPQRVMVFGWLMIQNKLLMIDNLVDRGWLVPNRCVMCKRASESVQHIFNGCYFAT